MTEEGGGGAGGEEIEEGDAEDGAEEEEAAEEGAVGHVGRLGGGDGGVRVRKDEDTAMGVSAAQFGQKWMDGKERLVLIGEEQTHEKKR